MTFAPISVGSLLICSILMMNILAEFMPGYYSDKSPKPCEFSCMWSSFCYKFCRPS